MSTEHDNTINIDDDTQGHAARYGGAPAKVETADDDAEGHALRGKGFVSGEEPAEDGGDDTGGHALKAGR